MSATNINVFNITGVEALTVGERISLMAKEFSLGIDKLNAKNFNKSIHTVDAKRLVWEMTNKNNYFTVSYKHIASPVFFNPTKSDFRGYVDTVTKLAGLVLLVTTQAEDLYRGLKKVAASGKLSHSLKNGDNLSVIHAGIEELKQLMSGENPQTRPVSDFYPSWQQMGVIIQEFNTRVKMIKSRDVEVLAKQADQVVGVAQLLKRKIDESEIVLSPEDFSGLNEVMLALDTNMKGVAQALTMLSELTTVFDNQIKQIPGLN